MLKGLGTALLLGACAALQTAVAEHGPASGPRIIHAHCLPCHDGQEPAGGFRVSILADHPDSEKSHLWRKSLEFVQAEFMPPFGASKLTNADRRELIDYLAHGIRGQDRPPGPLPRGDR